MFILVCGLIHKNIASLIGKACSSEDIFNNFVKVLQNVIDKIL